VQDHVARIMGWARSGEAACWKAGAPNSQSTPTFAPLPAPGVHRSPASRERKAHFMVGIEAEVAFRLGQDVTPNAAAHLISADIPSWLDAMTVSIELVDSRWKGGMAAPALLRLADLQAHGALVLGPWVPFNAVDWQRQTCSVRLNGVEQGPYQASHPCGDPLWVVPAWLRHAAARDGVVPAGTVVTTGTWCGIVWVQELADVHVVFDGIGEASVQLR
jgi:2-keto-4-pentenoate hydratase